MVFTFLLFADPKSKGQALPSEQHVEICIVGREMQTFVYLLVVIGQSGYDNRNIVLYSSILNVYCNSVINWY